MVLSAQEPPTCADNPPQGVRERMKISNRMFLLLQDDSGQNLIEYAFVAGLIGLAAVVAVAGLGTKISAAFNSIASRLTSSV